jgi:hypothetical protein
MSIYIPKGPYGLRIIEVHSQGEGDLSAGSYDGMDSKRVMLTVSDARGARIADAICDLNNPEIEEAKQWLLDFTRCSL